jgi:hypothetical protein
MSLTQHILQEGFEDLKKYKGNRNKIIDSVNNTDFYHGSINEFQQFSLNQFGVNDSGWLGYGVYMTNEYDYAESYASEDGYVYTCNVNISNPFILLNYRYSYEPKKLLNKINVHNSKQATNIIKSKGYDSVLLLYDTDYIDGFMELCIFNPNDITITNTEHKKY